MTWSTAGQDHPPTFSLLAKNCLEIFNMNDQIQIRRVKETEIEAETRNKEKGRERREVKQEKKIESSIMIYEHINI